MALNFQTISKGLGLVPQASAPASPVNGDCYYDSTLFKFRFRQNGAWVSINTTSGVVKARLMDADSTTIPVIAGSLTVDGVAAADGDRIFYSGLSGGPKIYLVGGGVTTLTVQLAFDGSSSPTDGDSVYVQEGDYYADNQFLYDGALVKNFLNNKTSLALLAAQTNTVFIELDTADFENLSMEYSIVNGSSRRNGILYLTSNGTLVDINDLALSVISDVGVAFSAVMSGANIQLRYSTTAGAATLKRTARIW